MYIHFLQALECLGSNDQERARLLNLNRKTLTRYRTGHIPMSVAALMRHPPLLRALADDAEQQIVEMEVAA